MPESYVNSSNMRLALPGGAKEPIGDRIVELAENEGAAVERDPRSEFIVYAPTGSITKERVLSPVVAVARQSHAASVTVRRCWAQASRRRSLAAMATMWSANCTFSRMASVLAGRRP